MRRNRTVRVAVLGSSVRRPVASGFPSLKRRVIAGLSLLVALALIVAPFRLDVLGAQDVGAKVLRPFNIAADRVTRPFQDTVSWYRRLIETKNENKKLRAQAAELRQQLILDESAVQQNVDLHNALNYKAPPSAANFLRINTAVVQNPQTTADTDLTIDAGSADGIVKDSIVVEPTGDPSGSGALVGTVTHVSHHVSRVTLLTAPESAVTATDLSNPHVIGAIRRSSGNSNVLILDRVSKSTRVRTNDTIITAGTLGPGSLKSKFPHGIPIGIIVSQSKSDTSLFQNIQVRLLIDFSSIQSVIVLVPRPPHR